MSNTAYSVILRTYHSQVTNIRSFLKSFELTYEKIYDLITDLKSHGFTMGGIAGAGVSYAMTGETTLNVLNLSMLKINIEGERLEGGLFEVKFGRNGVSTAIGAGGVDMSLGTIASTLKGGLNWGVSAGANAAAKRDGVENTATSLRAQWGYGDGKGNWGWEPDGSLDFNFDLSNKEIRDALFASTSLTMVDPKFSLNLNKMTINGNTGTIAFADMSMIEMMKLGLNLGIRDPYGTKYLSKPGDPPGNIALKNFVVDTENKLGESIFRNFAIATYRNSTKQLMSNGVKYEMGGGKIGSNGIVQGDSETMDCTALISYLTQTKRTGTSIFGSHAAFEKSSVAMPGDVFIYSAINSDGTRDSHAVIWLGKDEIVESADSTRQNGPRTDSLDRLENKTYKGSYEVQVYKLTKYYELWKNNK